MISAGIYALTVLALCAYILFQQVRWYRRDARAREARAHLITMLEKKSDPFKQEEVSTTGEPPLHSLRGQRDSGLGQRLGEEERRADT